MNEQKPVVIVGGGWAGMAAALELSQQHIPVTLFESAPNFGGRARTVQIDGNNFDNGQHLLIGAYHETLRLLTLMGVTEESVLTRLPLRLEIQNQLRLKGASLPAPLHLLWGLLTANGISILDRYRAIRMSLLLALRGYRLADDVSLAELLNQQHQSPWLVQNLWEPLSLATLNTPSHKASAQLFLRVLRDSFSQRRNDSDLLLSKVPLGELLCENVARFLQSTGDNHLHQSEKVSGLGVTAGKISGVVVNDETLPCTEVVLATSPTAAARLLQPIAQTHAVSEQIAVFHYQPITTVYLYYPDRTLPFPMLGLTGTLSQWLFDRAHCGQSGWFAVVISAEGKHDEWDKKQIATQVQQELAQQLPDWPQQAEYWHVIREKRATFECSVGIEAQRPGNTTPLEGLWLAGDYTNTGYPATLEGAVRSGVQCARRIIARRQQTD